MMYFTMTLMGVARQWYYNLERESIVDIDAFHKLFLTEFAPHRLTNRLLFTLTSIQQGENEGVRQYLHRLTELS